MRTTIAFTLAAASLGLAACATREPPVEIVSASVDLVDPTGVQRGDVQITQLDTGVRLVINAYGLSPGVHGAHIHETGSCIPPDFSSAGGHWNPLNREHGRESPGGQHMGDMPNLLIGEQGTGVLEVSINGARIADGNTGMLDDDGAAVVIHAMADDYRSQPSGDAGSRVACGAIEADF